MTLRKGTITENGKKINWNETATGVSYSDGKTSTPSPSNMDAKIAYKTAKAAIVVIPPTVPQQPDTKIRSITAKELDKAQLSNERVQLVKGQYNDQIWGAQLKNTYLDLSLAVFSGRTPAFEFRGDCSGAHIYGGLFQNCDRLFTLGNEGTVKGFTIEGITAINTKQIFGSWGYINKDGIFGKVIGFKMIGCTIKDSPDIGTAVWLNAAEDFDLSGNSISNINANNNNHNGIFMLGGNGIVSGNLCVNHQGDLVRATPYQVDTPGERLIIRNNRVRNSRKYGAFEVKTDDVRGFSAFKPCDVIIERNTAGQLNTSKDWDGKLLDAYDTFGLIEVRDNLCFEMVQSKTGKITDVINYASVSNVTRIEQSGNLYFENWKDAVVDLSSMQSKYAGVGAY